MSVNAFLRKHVEKLDNFFGLRRATCRRPRRRRLRRPSMELGGVVDVADLLMLPRLRSMPIITNILRLTTVHPTASLHASLVPSSPIKKRHPHLYRHRQCENTLI